MESATKGNLVSSSAVARRLGIRTATLGKMRSEGRGPKGWIRTSATRCAYFEGAVEEFLRQLQAAPSPVSNLRHKASSSTTPK